MGLVNGQHLLEAGWPAGPRIGELLAAAAAYENAVSRAVAEATRGLDIRWYYGKPDLAESPVGYKPAAQVRAQIERFGLAEVAAEIAPIGCVMVGDPGPRPWQRKVVLTPKQLRQIEHRDERRKDRQRLRGLGDGEDDDQ
jgi:tRNA-splicing ligase RtcB